MKSVRRYIGWVILFATVVPVTGRPSIAQVPVEPESVINYAYATWIGTGIYRFGERDIYVLRGNFSYNLREPKEDRWGWELLLPATIGLNDFRDLDAQVTAVTFIPGIEAQIPIYANWLLKPFGQIGIGKDFSGSDPSFIWGYGVRGLGNYPYKTMEFDIGAAITYANHSQSGSRGDDGFTKFDIGLNTRWLTRFNIQQRKNFINVFAVYSEFVNNIELFLPLEPDLELERLFKVGISLEGRPSFSIWFITFRGVGIDFTVGNDFRGIGLTTGFPF